MPKSRTLVRRLAGPALGALMITGVVACAGDATGVDEPAPGEALVIDGTEIASPELWAAAHDEGRITLYTAQPESTSALITEAFTESTGIEVDTVRLSGGPLAERVLAEVASDQLAADVIQASDLQFAEQLKEVDALDPYEVPWAGDLKEELVDPDGLYTPWSTAVMSLAYNSALVDPADVPDSWEELLDPKWKGKIGIFDIGTGGSAWSVALFQRQVVDDDYWAPLAAQDPSVFSGNAPLVEALTRGEIEIGTASPSLALRAKADGAPLEVIFPEEGYPAFVSFLSIPKGVANPNAAKVYLNWATSEVGQTQISSISGDYMSNSNVSAPEVNEVQFPAGGPWVPTSSDWIDLRDDWSREYRNVFGEAG